MIDKILVLEGNRKDYAINSDDYDCGVMMTKH